jgi:hypothetical protein
MFAVAFEGIPAATYLLDVRNLMSDIVFPGPLSVRDSLWRRA